MALLQFSDQAALASSFRVTWQNASGQYWRQDTGVFEAYNAARWTTAAYLVAVTEPGKAGDYQSTVPAMAAGTYKATLWYLPSGSASAANDQAWREWVKAWDGSTLTSIDKQDIADALADGVPLSDDALQELATLPNVSIIAPATGYSMDLFRADAYSSAQGTKITITKNGSRETHWPTTLSTVNFYAKPTAETLARYPSAASLGYSSAITCTITQDTGDSQSFYLELTSAQTDDITAAGSGGYSFWFKANVATAPKVLRSGPITWRPDESV